MPIHSTAIVSPGAEIDNTAEVGPYCVVGPHVRVGPRTRLLAHVVVDNHTTLGAGNTVHPFASLGGRPQDLKFRGEPSRLVIGDNNVFREAVTVNIGTEGGHMETRLGNNCLLMAYAHVAHDCVVGNNVVMANSVALAGHVTVEDFVIMGGMAGVHQFTRVGRQAFVAASAMVSQDVPPFAMAQGDRAEIVGLNIIGLKRAGWDRARINAMRQAYRALFQPTSTREQALTQLEREVATTNADVAAVCKFVRASERGLCKAHLAGAEEPET